MAQDPKPRSDLPVSLDRERERTIEVLSKHFAYDNLSLDELERRIEQVYRARSVPALRELTKDLPADATEAAQKHAVAVPDAFAPEHDRIVSIMAETKRRGLWRPPKRLDVWAIMSDTRLDLTEAVLASGVTEIRLRAVMAAVRIIVPPGVRVVVQPNALMSSVVDDLEDQPPLGSGAPVVRITGPAIMSEVKVKVRVRELPES
jgi:Domain of unknown function (DUF1707)/Cell wall-active antibiotics response 4TMS YvqF